MNNTHLPAVVGEAHSTKFFVRGKQKQNEQSKKEQAQASERKRTPRPASKHC